MNTFWSNWNILKWFWISQYFFTLLKIINFKRESRKWTDSNRIGWHGILRSNFEKFVTILLDFFNILVLHYLNQLVKNSTKIYKIRYFLFSHELRAHFQAPMKSVKSTGWQRNMVLLHMEVCTNDSLENKN